MVRSGAAFSVSMSMPVLLPGFGSGPFVPSSLTWVGGGEVGGLAPGAGGGAAAEGGGGKGRPAVVGEGAQEGVDRHRGSAHLIVVHAVGEAGASRTVADEVVAQGRERPRNIGV